MAREHRNGVLSRQVRWFPKIAPAQAEWAGRGINVNAIAPGYFATDNTSALRADAGRHRDILARIPAGLAIVAPPIGLIGLLLLLWLIAASRRREGQKYAGLRILR